MSSPIHASIRTLHHRPLSRSAFAAFGSVIENPTQESADVFSRPPELESSSLGVATRSYDLLDGSVEHNSPHGSLLASSSTDSPSIVPPFIAPTVEFPLSPILHPSAPQEIPANQNTALKYLSLSPLTNLYDQSPSQTPARTCINLFTCFPRVLTQVGESYIFKICILERHPFTTQTFIPMGLAAANPSTKYLVIVAPTLGPTKAFPNQGPPDLENLRAFVAHGGQAVTYAPGTWHAPMVVVGSTSVDFVVVQYCSGVPAEDCEENELEREGLGVVIDLSTSLSSQKQPRRRKW